MPELIKGGEIPDKSPRMAFDELAEMEPGDVLHIKRREYNSYDNLRSRLYHWCRRHWGPESVSINNRHEGVYLKRLK